MIKKYDDNYIDLKKVSAVERIYRHPNRYSFSVHMCSSTLQIHFLDESKDRLQSLRERLIKDWMEVANANPR